MTDQFSLIDHLLSEEEPDYSSLGLKKPKQMGDQLKDLTQAEADDAFLNEIGGDSNHTVVPTTSRSASSLHGADKTAVVGDTPLADAFRAVGAVNEAPESAVPGDQQKRANFLLSLGHRPSKVAALMGYDRKQTAEFLSSQAGQVGLAYIEPNFFMKSCEASHDKIQKEGRLLAMSVKKVAACNGCQHYKNGSCGLYCRPIVANGEELKAVITANLAKKDVKVATTMKAALASMHEGGEKVTAAPPYHRTEEKTITRTAGDKQAKVRKEASVEEIGKMLGQGIPLANVYKTAAAQYGKTSANSAIKRYLAGLKQSKAKIVLAALDCGFLKSKLGTGNAIVGEKKCASCSFRNGMHCGLTGGTLLSFPGMDKASSKKISHDGVKDGQQVLFEWELLDKPEEAPIVFKDEEEKPEEINIELTRTSQIDLED